MKQNLTLIDVLAVLEKRVMVASNTEKKKRFYIVPRDKFMSVIINEGAPAEEIKYQGYNLIMAIQAYNEI